MKRRAFRGALAVAFLLLASEVGLRRFAGFGTPVLMMADPQVGYLPKPNQKVRRFGRRIEYNAYSMRSGPVKSLRRDRSRWRVLCLGDSVTNGGSLVDQAETYPALLERKLQELRPAEVLNASVGGWGLGNVLAYVRTRGLSEADWVVLQFGTADLTETKALSTGVGRDPNLPDRNPLCALCELWSRYLWPRLQRESETSFREPTLSRELQLQKNFETIANLVDEIKRGPSRPIILFTFNRDDLRSSDPELEKVRSIVKEGLARQGVEVVDLLEAFRRENADGSRYFVDFIHPNAAGNERIADELKRYFVTKLK